MFIMKKFINIIFITVLLLTSCSKKTIVGNYKAINKNSLIDSISFDGTVAVFGGSIGKLIPGAKYEVKEYRLYIETYEGILVFNIIDNKTIEGTNSIVRGDVFKK